MITVRLIGMTKMLAGNQSSLSVSVPDGRYVKDLVGLIEARYPAIGELIQKKKVLVSVNQEGAHEETIINDGDEIALLPPFAGGSGQEPIDESQFLRVQRENFSIDQELDRVRSRSKRIGGIATFLGIARDRSCGRDVDGITFEHYEGMAQKKLCEIRERALKDFDILELLIIHRYGEIAIGENTVASLQTSPAFHRFHVSEGDEVCIVDLVAESIAPIEHPVKMMVADRTILVFVGDFDGKALAGEVKKAFGDWQKAAAPMPKLEAPAARSPAHSRMPRARIAASHPSPSPGCFRASISRPSRASPTWARPKQRRSPALSAPLSSGWSPPHARVSGAELGEAADRPG